MKKIAILGSTGSIGTQTLEIVREQGDLQVLGLSAGSNAQLLEAQIREFHPQIAVLSDENAAKELAVRVADLPVKIYHGMDGLLEMVTMPEVEIVVTAIVGMIGILPTMAAIEAGKDIALANKETLVTAGHLVMEAARKNNVSILPVDSEHSAIFQSLHGEEKRSVRKILLTASGGPFRGMTREQLKEKKPSDALKHPNWSMGSKITIDSATMINKGLELIEAKWLFDVDISQVEILVHPQSIIHSAVEYQDGAVIAQLGLPDMKLPIQYALYYPTRRPMTGAKLDLAQIGQLTFEKPDFGTFEGLKLAVKAAKEGGISPVVFNAANEYLVARFLKEEIGFLDIPYYIGMAMEEIPKILEPSIEQILLTEKHTYEYLERRLK